MKTFDEYINKNNPEQIDESLKGLIGSTFLTAALLLSAEAEAKNKQTTNKPSVVASINQVSPEEKVARTIFAEAAGESLEGKKAAASVIYNRAKRDPSKMVGVVTAPKQFSSWNAGMPKRGTGKAWEESLQIAKELMSGTFKPITKHTFYYNPKLANPTWAFKRLKDGKKVRIPYQDIGNHRFLTIGKA